MCEFPIVRWGELDEVCPGYVFFRGELVGDPERVTYQLAKQASLDAVTVGYLFIGSWLP